MIIESKFKPAWWLGNPHVQTIYSTINPRNSPPVSHTERFELPDGDFLDLVWSTKDLPADAPLVIILHGLGGSIHSKYVSGFMHTFRRRGWRSVLMHFRGASDEPNRLSRVYHSGDTGDLNYFLQQLQMREADTVKAIVGVSLGGNVLLKWLGEQGKIFKKPPVEAAVAVSVPLQLDKVASHAHYGLTRFYQIYLLRKIKQTLKRKNYPSELKQRLEKIDCFWTFDDQITAPLHGFPHVHAYYKESSSRQYLKYINIPTLIIQAKDDPLLTPDVLPLEEELAKDVHLEISPKGGHVGFISGNIPGKPVYWLDERLPEYLERYLK